VVNYRALGYRRMIYTNTVSVIDRVAGELAAAMGDRPRVTAVLLTCSDATARRRLAQREIGTALDWHLERSAQMARRLDKHTPGWAHRVATDCRVVADIAAEVITLTGWVTN
jgi:hypothetical protein